MNGSSVDAVRSVSGNVDDDGNLVITVNGVSGAGIPLPKSDIALILKMPMTLDISPTSVSREEAQQNDVCGNGQTTYNLPFEVIEDIIFFNIATGIINNTQGRKAIFNYPISLISNPTIQVIGKKYGNLTLDCTFEGAFYAALNSGGTKTYSLAKGTLTLAIRYSPSSDFSSTQATISNLTFTNDQYFAIANPQIFRLIVNSLTPM